MKHVFAKRFLSILLVAIMLVSAFAACGETLDDSSAPESVGSLASAPESSEAQNSSSAESSEVSVEASDTSEDNSAEESTEEAPNRAT